MKFRADEEAQNNTLRAIERLAGRNLESADRPAAQAYVEAMIAKHGPVVDSYPCWHPFVAGYKNPRGEYDIETVPSADCGYKGLDHTVYLRDAIITCPYGGVHELICSVNDWVIECSAIHGVANVEAEEIEGIKLYAPHATPVLITCTWEKQLGDDGMVPASVALPLFLEKLLPFWRKAEHSEPWSSMAPYILGRPYGNRSSLFVNQETGLVLKKQFHLMNQLGVYGRHERD